MVGKKMYFILADIRGEVKLRYGIIKEEYPNNLIIVEVDDECQNLGLPSRLYPRMEYSMFPQRNVENSTTDIRMFGRDLAKLKAKWKEYYENQLKVLTKTRKAIRMLIKDVDDLKDE